MTGQSEVAKVVAATDVLAPVAVVPIAIVAAVLIAAAVTFMTVAGLNAETFLAVQQLTVALPDTAWSMITICGEGVVAYALLSVTLPWQPRWFAAALPAGILAGLYSNLLKHLFALPRPVSVLDPTHLHVIGQALHANSFPSGHAVTAFTLAAVLVLASRTPWTTAAWAVPGAVVIAFSRIAVGAHWPADIAAGAAGGWICGALGVVVVARWRGWNRPSVLRAMGVIVIGVGISLFVIALGYPLASPFQRVVAVVAVVAGAVAVVRPRLDPLLLPVPPSRRA